MSERWVEQRFADDCWNACVASLFGLPYEAVADMPRGHDPGWHKAWNEWFAEHGYAWWERPLSTERPSAAGYYGFGEITIVSYESPRMDGDHCVIQQRGKVLWDPHPQREMGLGRLTDVTVLIPLDPASRPTPQPFDVERLRQAMVAYYNHRLNMGMPGPNRRAEAYAIAAEYARLGSQEGSTK